jgi:hypothetical protein
MPSPGHLLEDAPTCRFRAIKRWFALRYRCADETSKSRPLATGSIAIRERADSNIGIMQQRAMSQGFSTRAIDA